ncbi:hypothetical protein D3C85_734170 [compost metagenome]
MFLIVAKLNSDSGQIAKCNHAKLAICTARNFSRTAKLLQCHGRKSGHSHKIAIKQIGDER